jgi:hypothetical protein
VARDNRLDLRLCVSHFCVRGRVSDLEGESNLRQSNEPNVIHPGIRSSAARAACLWVTNVIAADPVA